MSIPERAFSVSVILLGSIAIALLALALFRP
jgi:hypothetical protein